MITYKKLKEHFVEYCNAAIMSTEELDKKIILRHTLSM